MIFLGDHDIPLTGSNFGKLTAFRAIFSHIFTAHVCCVQLSQVGAEHAGTYTVTATNRVGSVSTTATLTVSQGARFKSRKSRPLMAGVWVI